MPYLCPECGLDWEREGERPVSGWRRRLCPACRSDGEVPPPRRRSSLLKRRKARCRRCDRPLRRGFCRFCYWRTRPRTRGKYEPIG